MLSHSSCSIISDDLVLLVTLSLVSFSFKSLSQLCSCLWTFFSITYRSRMSSLWLLEDMTKSWNIRENTWRNIISRWKKSWTSWLSLNESMQTAARICRAESRIFDASKKIFSAINQWTDEIWWMSDRYCKFTEKDFLTTLKKISINVLYVFFDWVLFSWKNIVNAISTLQTY